VIIDSPAPRLGIITSGKSYLDVRQAFDDLGIDDALAGEIGIPLYKVGMLWPLEADGARRFAKGLDEILVVEEKQPAARVPAQGRALQLARGRGPARDRQVRREGRMGPHGARRRHPAGQPGPAITAACRCARSPPAPGSDC